MRWSGVGAHRIAKFAEGQHALAVTLTTIHHAAEGRLELLRHGFPNEVSRGAQLQRVRDVTLIHGTHKRWRCAHALHACVHKANGVRVKEADDSEGARAAGGG